MEKVETIELKIPNLGEAESTQIIEINISEGSKISEEDPLIVLESEKAAMEIPSDFAGEVLKVFVKEGQEVSEGQTYAEIKTTNKIVKETSERKANAIDNRQTESSVSEKKYSFDFSGINAGPAVRKYARELDINLELINGTGRNSRITKDDLKNFIHSNPANRQSFPNQTDFIKYGAFEIIKLSKIRTLGAKNMSNSWSSIPHVTHFEEAEMSRIGLARSALKASPLAFIVKIVADTLKKHKIFNSSLLDNNEVLIKDYINIGIAVDTHDGLVVPVIKDVTQKNIQEISDEILELAKRAKDKKLLTKNLEGSTFTISSLGKIGGTGFTPIINPPEVAILAISRTKKVLQLVKSKPEEIEILPFSLSYDHRVINGADAGKFMNDIKENIENYSQ